MRVYQLYYIILAGLLLTGSFSTYGQPLIKNPHKFSKNNWDFDERCNPCHIYSSETKASTADSFLISYESDSLTASDSMYISGASKLCFTCHDGSVAAYSPTTKSFRSDKGSSNIHSNHPVSIKYQVNSLNKYKLYNPDLTMSGLGNTISKDMLINGRVECNSCHDAHFSMQMTACSSCPPVKSTQQRAKEFSSLWKKNRKSALCLTCHNI